MLGRGGDFWKCIYSTLAEDTLKKAHTLQLCGTKLRDFSNLYFCWLLIARLRGFDVISRRRWGKECLTSTCRKVVSLHHGGVKREIDFISHFIASGAMSHYQGKNKNTGTIKKKALPVTWLPNKHWAPGKLKKQTAPQSLSLFHYNNVGERGEGWRRIE